MEIKNLGNTSLEIIVDCMNQSFQNYFVKIPTDVDFWAKRYKAARVDFNLSYGVFENEKLVAFVIHGIDIHNENNTAFNTGTGVLEAYRGRQLIDQIYDFATPLLRKSGISKCMLEVIEENHRAVRVYERIGFQKDRFLRCYNGEFNEFDTNTEIQEIDISSIKDLISPFQKYYSWDHSLDAVLKGGEQFKTYLAHDKSGKKVGYFTLNSTNNSLVQVELFEGNNWNQIFEPIKKMNSFVRINNVDDQRKELLSALSESGLQNHINQFEMTLFI